MSDNSEKDVYKSLLEKHIGILIIATQYYSKAVLSLSIASLGFTFAFVKWLNIKTAISPCLLYATWVFLILSMATVLCELLLNQVHSSHRIKFLYTKIIDNLPKLPEEHWTDSCMLSLSICSSVFYFISVIAFSVFVSINI